jgi:hypothetical protein
LRSCRPLPLLRFTVGVGLHPRGDGVLLRDQQATNLQELVGLLAGELVGVADGLHLARSRPARPIGAVRSVALHRPSGVLLPIQALEQGIVGLLLRLARQAAVLIPSRRVPRREHPPVPLKHGELR